jgi:single-strand DNA-binding protein
MGRDGQPAEETTWFRVSAWGKQAESCNQYLSKGRQVMVEGRLMPDKDTGGPRMWTGNDGQQRASYDLRDIVVLFLGGGGGGGGGGGRGNDYSNNDYAGSQDSAPITEDEIPF